MLMPSLLNLSSYVGSLKTSKWPVDRSRSTGRPVDGSRLPYSNNRKAVTQAPCSTHEEIHNDLPPATSFCPTSCSTQSLASSVHHNPHAAVSSVVTQPAYILEESTASKSTGATMMVSYPHQNQSNMQVCSADDRHQQADRLEVAEIMEQLKKGWDGTTVSGMLDPERSNSPSAAINDLCTSSSVLHSRTDSTTSDRVDGVGGIMCRFTDGTLTVDLKPLFTVELLNTINKNGKMESSTVVPVELMLPFGKLLIRLPFRVLSREDSQSTESISTESVLSKSTQENAVTSMNGKTLWQCHLCNKQFTRRSTLDCHLRSHNNQRPYKCQTCSKQFRQLAHLTGHSLTHTNAKPHKCITCGISFSLLSNLRRHQHTCVPSTSQNINGIVDSNRPHACQQCPKRFRFLHHLKSHEAIHMDRKPYSCSVCGAHFSLPMHLSKHKRLVHNMNEPISTSDVAPRVKYRCCECPRQFSCTETLNAHVSTHLDVPKSESILHSCHICARTFNRPGKLRRHIVQRHPYNAVESHPTAIMTTSRPSISTHQPAVSLHEPITQQTTNTPIAKYQCQLCNMMFSRSFNLRRHLQKRRCGAMP